MKSVIILLLLAAMSMASDEGCRVLKPRKVVCKRELNGISTTAVYTMQSDGAWMGKLFLPATTSDGYHNVNTYQFGKLDIDSISTDYARWLIGGPGGMDSVKSVPDSLKLLTKAFLTDLISKGNKELFVQGFEAYLGKYSPVSTMYCKGPYVRTYRYNSLTGMKTDRRDHHLDKYGTYCEDFLANDEYFWYPPKSR